MSSSVDQIKSRIDILSLVSSYMKLDKAGKSWKGKCPFHNEKTPSFFVSPERGSYYCFGCQASGDIFTFVEEFEGLDFKGALRLLADRAGVVLETYSKRDKETKNEKDKIYMVMEEATKYFENNLKENKSALEYLKSRGLTEKSIKDFRIGFAILDWRKLYDYLKSKNFSDQEIERAGLIKHPLPASPKGGGVSSPSGRVGRGYDRFRGRIMFPIADSSGRIIAFSGRLLEADLSAEALAKAGAKYLNSPETPIFNKSSVLFGIDKAKDSIRKNNFSILVEGQMDLVLSHQAGYKNTVATSGTALSDTTVSKENVISNLGLVRRLSPNIVLSFDADKAGFNASNRAGKIALSLGMDVKVASLPEGIDPADLISQKGADAWKEAIRNSKHLIEFMLGKVLKDSRNDTRGVRLDSARLAGRKIKDVILPYVNALNSSIEKMHFIKKISDASGIPQNALQDDLKKIEAELKSEKKEIEEAEESLGQLYRKDYILRKLLGIILWQKTLKKADEKQNIDPVRGREGSQRPSASNGINVDNMLKEIAGILKITPEEVLAGAEENKEDFIFEAEVFYGKGADLKKDIQELVFNLKEEYLKEELSRKMQELHTAEERKPARPGGGDIGGGIKILKEINEINNKIQGIKNKKT